MADNELVSLLVTLAFAIYSTPKQQEVGDSAVNTRVRLLFDVVWLKKVSEHHVLTTKPALTTQKGAEVCYKNKNAHTHARKHTRTRSTETETLGG